MLTTCWDTRDSKRLLTSSTEIVRHFVMDRPSFEQIRFKHKLLSNEKLSVNDWNVCDEGKWPAQRHVHHAIVLLLMIHCWFSSRTHWTHCIYWYLTGRIPCWLSTSWLSLSMFWLSEHLCAFEFHFLLKLKLSQNKSFEFNFVVILWRIWMWLKTFIWVFIIVDIKSVEKGVTCGEPLSHLDRRCFL
jgi:hypothetical protein